jgi:hypothetical protein
VQHDDPLDTDEGDELLDDRDVSDGTSESASLSVSESSDSSRVAWLKRDVSFAIVAGSYSVVTIWRVWFGLMGVGEIILDGERARPLGISVLTRRECRLALLLLVAEVREEAAGAAAEPDFAPGISRTFSLRPVVGSVVNSLAGSCETW